MKIFLLLLMIPFVVYSQNSFEYIGDDTLNTYCISSFVDNQGYYIAVGSKRAPNSTNPGAFVLRFQNIENVTKKTFIKEGVRYGLAFGTQKDNNHYFFIGHIFSPSPQLYLLELDEELNFLQEFYYDVPSTYNSLLIQDAFFDEGGIIILRGNLDDPAPGDEDDIYLAKINTNGELLDTTIMTDLNNNYGAEVLKKLDGTGYYILGTSQYEKVVLDNDLNVVEYLNFPVGSVITPPLAIRWLPNGNIIVADMVNQNVPGAFYDIRVSIVDEGFNTIKDTTFFDEGKNRLADFSSLDYVDPNNIWVVSHNRTWKSSKDEWENARVYIVDSELNVKGAKYFAGDIDVYLYSTKVLDDGGCIITGVVPMEGKSSDHHAYIRKIMPEDVFTDAEETPAPDDSDVLMFPNPVKNVLNIETYRKGLSLSLYDGNGKNVIVRHSLNVPYTEINTQSLKNGVYLYSIYDGNKVIETGKIIKN